MLRNLMLDLDTMSEERFNGLMREFYQTWHGRAASTADFRALAEQHAGQELGWFFDQWVYGTAVPKYRFAWKSARSSDTTWTVRCRVEQSGVPEGFRMPVAIRVDFAGGKFARARHLIEGPVSEFDLPPLPLEPVKVTFNDLASVLCEVENAKR
jgi:aminopeptidase N